MMTSKVEEVTRGRTLSRENTEKMVAMVDVKSKKSKSSVFKSKKQNNI